MTITLETLEPSVDEPVRHLVTVQRIVDVTPIEGYDRIDIARVLGYECVVKRGDFKIGDLCVYHEVDSLVPTAGPKGLRCYEFLDAKAKDFPEEDVAVISVVSATGGTEDQAMRAMGARRARIKTIRLGGKYSQGLALPLGEVTMALCVDLLHASNMCKIAYEGMDVTAELGVTKYDPSASLGVPGARGARGPGLRPWPANAPSKTDEANLQSWPGVLEEMRGVACYVTGKIDGSSMTAIRRHTGELVVCSRNFQVVPVEGEAPDMFTLAAAEFDLANRLPPGYAIQAELAGPGIQKNRAGYPAKRLCVFNVFRYVDDESPPEQLGFKKATGFCADHGLQFVPVLWSGWVISAHREPTEWIPNPQRHDLPFFIGQAEAQKYANGNPCEGIVVRPMEPRESKTLRGRRLSFKVKSPSYEALG